MIISRLLAATMVAGQPEPHAGSLPGSASGPVNTAPSPTNAASTSHPGALAKPRA
jgi:hypothetical protein